MHLRKQDKQTMTHKTPADFALWAALPMAHTSKIEGRIKMVLDTTRRRTSSRRFLLLAALMGAAALVPLSMLRPAAQAAPVIGTPQAALGPLSGTPPFNGAAETQYVRENSKFLRGQKFSPHEAAVQEKQLAANPDDYSAHLCLLGYYLNSAIFSKPLSFAAARPAYRQQVFWLIQNHPESLLFSREDLWVPRHYAPAVFTRDKALWQAQFTKHPSSAVILGNAAGYYTISDKALGEEYLLRAQALEPNNPEWPNRLAELYQLNGPHPTAATIQQSAQKALAEYEKTVALEHRPQPDALAELAKTAFDAGAYDKARQYANDLLQQGEQIAAAGKADPRTPAFIFQEDDNALHDANSVLGRLALHNDDISGAEAHLLAMGRVSGSPRLNSAGPNMQLAHDLLERGDRQPVLAYFDECEKFWKDKNLSEWRSQVEKGKIPDFGGNLVY
jgi:tetratricopeptide (TPR) repeat protein